ncbi:MAG: serine/threonine-protein kinase [Proteobacteria bacterium]|nr:serine/threonine-protein kinase [Pseudomonadota bacterium]
MTRTGEQMIAAGDLILGKYQIEETLGRGGMGIVVKARHTGLDELVAIKLLRDDIAIDEDTIARFLREAQAVVKLKSEHVARVSDVGRFEDGKPYMVMEFLEGSDIGQMIDQNGSLHPSLAIDLLIQACDALAEAHSIGIIHRDVKPSNLFVTFRPDGSPILKVLDFGISKSAGNDLSLTQTSSMLGTPAYMSPEQMRSARKVDARTDVWSLGSVLYEAVEGRLPFAAESFPEMCVMVAVEQPAPMLKMPPALQPIVMRCLEKNPDLRYPSVAELAFDLMQHAREPHRARMLVDRMFRTLGRRAAGITGGSDGGATGTGIPVHLEQQRSAPIAVASPTISEPARKSRRWLGFVGAGVLAAVVGVAIVASSSAPPTPTDPGSAAVIPTNDPTVAGSAPANGSAEIRHEAGSGSDATPPQDGSGEAGRGSSVAIAVGSGSAVGAGSGSGSGSAAIAATTRVRPKPIVRTIKPVGSGSAKPSTGMSAGSATPSSGSNNGSGSAVPTKPSCDPFNGRTTCK